MRYEDRFIPDVVWKIITDTSARRRVKIDHVMSASRFPELVETRRQISKKLREILNEDGTNVYSYPTIGKFFNRDHSGIYYMLHPQCRGTRSKK